MQNALTSAAEGRNRHAIMRFGFEQQLDPVSGVATTSPIHSYSPAALVFLHGAKTDANATKKTSPQILATRPTKTY